MIQIASWVFLGLAVVHCATCYFPSDGMPSGDVAATKRNIILIAFVYAVIAAVLRMP